MSNHRNRQGLLLSDAERMRIEAEHQAEAEKQQALHNIIHFRATCAMNNLGELIGYWEANYTDDTRPGNDTHIIDRAVDLAEKLMVKLCMVKDQAFFRELDRRSQGEGV